MKKRFNIAIQMDPLEKINPNEDSTFVIAKEAQSRGHKTFHYLPKDISLKNNRIMAKGYYFKIINSNKKFFKREKKQLVNLNNFNCVLIRQDPPFNMRYITATYFLEMLNKKVIVINNPSEIRNNPEKLSMFKFKNIIHQTLISENLVEIENFVKKNQYTILKPMYGNGGEGIEKVKKGSLQNKNKMSAGAFLRESKSTSVQVGWKYELRSTPIRITFRALRRYLPTRRMPYSSFAAHQ
mgnify:CR=1 FL=1